MWCSLQVRAASLNLRQRSFTGRTLDLHTSCCLNALHISAETLMACAVLHRPSRTARGTHHPLRAVSLPAADVLTAVRGRAPASASGRTTSGSTRDATAATGFVQSRPAKSVKIVDKSQRSGRFAPAQQTQSLLKPAWQSQAAQHAQAVAERQEVYREEGRRRMEPLQVGTKHASPSSSGHALDLAEYLSAYDQLPGWDTVQREDALYFDWSGQTDYTPVRKQVCAWRYANALAGLLSLLCLTGFQVCDFMCSWRPHTGESTR